MTCLVFSIAIRACRTPNRGSPVASITHSISGIFKTSAAFSVIHVFPDTIASLILVAKQFEVSQPTRLKEPFTFSTLISATADIIKPSI